MREKIKAFLQKSIVPLMEEKSPQSFPLRKAFTILGEAGLLGLAFPAKYGGADGSFTDFAIVAEEIFRLSAPLGMAFSNHIILGCWPIFQFGTEEQKQKYLVDLLSGRKITSFALAESSMTQDLYKEGCTAIKDGKRYILNGRKVLYQSFSSADQAIVFAATDRTQKFFGVSAFIVDKGKRGLSFECDETEYDQAKPMQTTMIMNHCSVEETARLGEEGDGCKIAIAAIHIVRASIAVHALGHSRATFSYMSQLWQQEQCYSNNDAKNFRNIKT
ncbi:MAG: acyl-CoA dehydrogenase family protein [Sporomusaceae bacterium]|nr:acyl-CoA dehydrogenase family protein [Sporomusaceae bacterium]